MDDVPGRRAAGLRGVADHDEELAVAVDDLVCVPRALVGPKHLTGRG